MSPRFLLGCLLIAACGSRSAPPVAPPAPEPAQVVASNALRGDYVGSEACADCHAQIYAKWKSSPMRNMTRAAAGAVIRAPFDGATLRVGDDVATMEQEGADRFIRLQTPKGTTRYRVTKVVGGRYREDFVGVTDASPLEHVLPATYFFATKSWRYKGYSVMVKERPAMSARGVWSRECIGCHNTLPLATTLYDELYGPNLPGYQGKLSDRVMPADRTWRVRSLDDTGLAKAIAGEIAFLGAAPPETTSLRELLPAAARASQQRLDGTHLVEIGIGCEACHNGAREHVENEHVRPTYKLSSPLLGMTPPRGDGSRAQWINHTCAKCHTVLFTRYPYTWEGGLRSSANPGGSTTNSGEGRDFELGACSSQMACTSCHDPHTVDSAAHLEKLATPEGNTVCAGCHATIARDVAAHSHHKPGGAGTSCIACHMPKKNMGLDYSLVRYHRIGSPNDPARVLGDRPVECALCHTDRSPADLVANMEAWWGKTYDRTALRKLYGGDASAPALLTTLRVGKPHEQAAAIATLGQSGTTSALRAIAPHLTHDYPLVRFFAHRAIETLTGAPLPLDVGASAADLKPRVDAWLRSLP
ncbi:MAG: hypothetical protein KF773_40235 [Deltaproteobacteria bacterium]|nr:hypothetical protein [Deltaproteobacteria bacterium]